MIAAGTSAPITIAASATPVNQSGKKRANSSGTIARRVLRHDARGDRAIAQQRQQAEQERINRQQRGIAPDHFLAFRRQHAGDRMRIDEERHRRPERHRRIGEVLRRREVDRDRLRPRGQHRRGDREDVRPSAELRGNHDGRGNDGHVDQAYLSRTRSARVRASRWCTCTPPARRTRP